MRSEEGSTTLSSRTAEYWTVGRQKIEQKYGRILERGQQNIQYEAGKILARSKAENRAGIRNNIG
jgi:hypothetical protein